MKNNYQLFDHSGAVENTVNYEAIFFKSDVFECQRILMKHNYNLNENRKRKKMNP